MTPNEQVDLARLSHELERVKSRITDELAVIVRQMREAAATEEKPPVVVPMKGD